MADRLRLYLDQHVPAGVAEALRRRGVDVLTTQEAGRCGMSDPLQLAMALAEGRVLVTFDTDFLGLAAGGREDAGIAFCAATKYSVGQPLHSLLLPHDVLAPLDTRNQVEFL